MQTKALLSVRNLGISYPQAGTGGHRWILKGLDLDVREGEFVTIMGSSGAGKSTLLNVLAQTLQPASGEILFNGEKVGGAEMQMSPGARRQIGYVTQDDNLLPWKTVWENVIFPLALVRKPTSEDEERVRAILDRVGLGSSLRLYPHQLSGGMKKRASLARTLAYNPPVVLMDEPFGALDAETRAHLQTDLLALWSAERKTVLFVTHDINEAIALGDRVVVLSGSPGRLVLEQDIEIPRPRDPEEIFKQSGFSDYYDAIRSRLRGANPI